MSVVLPAQKWVVSSMFLLTNILTGSASGNTKAIALRGLTLVGRGRLVENLRPHTISAELSMPPYVLVDMQVGNFSLTPLFSSCTYMKICLIFLGNVLFSSGIEKLGCSLFCISPKHLMVGFAYIKH